MGVRVEILHLDLFVADPRVLPGRHEHAVGQVFVVVEGLHELALHFCGLGKGVGDVTGFLVHDHAPCPNGNFGYLSHKQIPPSC